MHYEKICKIQNIYLDRFDHHHSGIISCVKASMWIMQSTQFCQVSQKYISLGSVGNINMMGVWFVCCMHLCYVFERVRQ